MTTRRRQRRPLAVVLLLPLVHPVRDRAHSPSGLQEADTVATRTRHPRPSQTVQAQRLQGKNRNAGPAFTITTLHRMLMHWALQRRVNRRTSRDRRRGGQCQVAVLGRSEVQQRIRIDRSRSGDGALGLRSCSWVNGRRCNKDVDRHTFLIVYGRFCRIYHLFASDLLVIVHHCVSTMQCLKLFFWKHALYSGFCIFSLS